MRLGLFFPFGGGDLRLISLLESEKSVFTSSYLASHDDELHKPRLKPPGGGSFDLIRIALVQNDAMIFTAK